MLLYLIKAWIVRWLNRYVGFSAGGVVSGYHGGIVNMARVPLPGEVVISKLHPLAGGRPAGAPRAGKRRSLGEPEQMTCSRCLVERGVETSVFRRVVIAPQREPSGKIIGGTEAWACDVCGTVV